MTMKNCKSFWLSHFTCLFLIAAIFISSSMIVLAAPGSSLAGEIVFSGGEAASVESAVTLDGQPVLTGRTFFGSGVISTPDTKSVTVNLGKLGRVTLAPKSILSVTLAENSIGGELTAGQIQVFNKAGVAVNIKTKDNVVTNNAEKAGDFSVDVRSGSTVSTFEKGEIFLENGQPVAAAALTDNQKKALYIIIPIVAAIIIIAIVVRDNDDNRVSPTR